MKDSNQKRDYEAPGLTTVTFKTERGYAFSTFIHQNDVNPQQVDNTTFGRSSYGEATAESNTQQSWF